MFNFFKQIDKKITGIVNNDKKFILQHLLKKYGDDLFNIFNIKDFYQNPVITIEQKMEMITDQGIRKQANKLKEKIKNLQEWNFEYEDPDARIFYKGQDLDYISQERILQAGKETKISNYLVEQYFEGGELLSENPFKGRISTKSFLKEVIEKNDKVGFGDFGKKIMETNLISDIDIIISDDKGPNPIFILPDHKIYLPTRWLIPIKPIESEGRAEYYISQLNAGIEIHLVKTLLHEIAHGITMPKIMPGIKNGYETDQILKNIIQRKVDSMRSNPKTSIGSLTKSFSKVKRLLGEYEEYGLSKFEEFIAEIYTDGIFQRKIKEIDNGKTYKKIKEDLATLVGADLLVDMKELQYSLYDDNARIAVINALDEF